MDDPLTSAASPATEQDAACWFLNPMLRPGQGGILGPRVDATPRPSKSRAFRVTITRSWLDAVAGTTARPKFAPHPGYDVALAADLNDNTIDAVYHGDASRSAPSVTVTS